MTIRDRTGYRGAFSLIELLIVMMIIGIVAGSVCFVFSGLRDGDKLIRREAENFALWLVDRMSRAQVEECSFKLSMSQHGSKNASFRLTWQGGTLHGKTETYESSEARIFPVTGDLSRSRLFDGEWSSMTPALTVNVKPHPADEGRTLYVVVSGAGCVTLKDKVN